jgi:hypothetical protein
MKDYLPHGDAEFLIWLHNFYNKFNLYAGQFNILPSDVSDLNTQIGNMTTSVQNVATQKEMMAKVVSQKNSIRKELESQVRQEAARLKAHKNYTDHIGQELGIVGSKSSFDPTTVKPKPEGKVTGGLVRIKFQKKGIGGVNVYRRQKGEVDWQFRARDNNSPYEERIVLKNAAVPEHWEYRLIGVIKDVEVGQPSDIVEVIVGA